MMVGSEDEVGEESPDAGAQRGGKRGYGGWRQRRVVGGRQREVKVRFTDADYERLAARAALAGTSIPAYLALAGLRAQESSSVAGDRVLMRVWGEELRALRQQVYRVGLNVNQVARLLHGTGEVERQASATYRGAVRAIAALDPIIERCTGSSGRVGMLPDPDATVAR